MNQQERDVLATELAGMEQECPDCNGEIVMPYGDCRRCRLTASGLEGIVESMDVLANDLSRIRRRSEYTDG